MPATAALIIGHRVALTDQWIKLAVTFAGVRYRVEAKVYAEPSQYGIGEGCVSKLWIHLPEFGGSTVYNYDRGLDVDAAPAGLVDALVAYLEGR